MMDVQELAVRLRIGVEMHVLVRRASWAPIWKAKARRAGVRS